MSSSSHIRKLISESGVYGLSNTLAKFTAVILIPIYTRVFTPDEYGVVALLTSLMSLFMTFLVLGLDSASARWYYDDEDMQMRRSVISSWFWCQLAVSVFAGAILLICANPVSRLLFKSDQYAPLIEMVAIIVPLTTFFKVCGNLLRYQRRAWLSSGFSFADSIVTIGLIILFVVVWKHGLAGVYKGRLLGALFTALMAGVILRGWISPGLFSWKRLKAMLRFSLPLVPAGIAIWVRLSSDRFILQMFQTQGEVGLFSVAFQIASAIGLFTTAFGFAYGPFAFSILNEATAKETYARVLELYAVAGIFAAVVLSSFADVAFHVITTPEYFEAIWCVPYLAFSFVIYGALTIASLGPSIVKQSGPVARAILLSAAVSIAMNFAFIPAWGKEAAAVSNLVASLTGVVYLFGASQRKYPIPYRFKPVIVFLLLAGLATAVGQRLYGTTFVSVAVRCGLCLILPVAAYYLNLLRKEDLAIFRRLGSFGRGAQ